MTTAMLDAALADARRAGADYADVRLVTDESERVVARNGALERVAVEESTGIGVRVVANGAWGFACTVRHGDEAAVAAAARRAVEVARAAALVGHPAVALAPTGPSQGQFRTPHSLDPFSVTLDDKRDLVTRASDAAHQSPLVRSSEVFVAARRQRKRFRSTEGADTDQEILVCGAGLNVVVRDDADAEQRSYPGDPGGCFGAAGFEFVRGLDLVGNAQRVVDEAIETLRAPDCVEGETTVVIGATQMALQIHESCGHAVELDRVMGTEVSLAGRSFISPADIGRLEYGSDNVTIIADATTPGGLGTFGWDDEGVPAQRAPIVERGRFVGFLSSRETAQTLMSLGGAMRTAGHGGGTMRAESWHRIPLIRMVNVNLEPGDGTLDEIIRDTESGVFIDAIRSWSIDDLRLNFHFACQTGWEIKRGRLTRRLRAPVYSGRTPEFWRSCDAVAGPSEWRLAGIPTCGKGDPAQLVGVGHGSSPARFRGVRIGCARRGTAR